MLSRLRRRGRSKSANFIIHRLTAAAPDAPRGLASPSARAPESDAPRAESRRKDSR